MKTIRGKWTSPSPPCLFLRKLLLTVTHAQETREASAREREKRKRERLVLLPASSTINEVVLILRSSYDHGGFEFWPRDNSDNNSVIVVRTRSTTVSFVKDSIPLWFQCELKISAKVCLFVYAFQVKSHDNT